MSELTQKQADSRLIPESTKKLIQLIGTEAATRLLTAFGGTTIRIKATNSKAGAARYAAIIDAIGHEAANALSKEHGGKALYISNGYAPRINRRNIAIQRLFNTLLTHGYSASGAIELIAITGRLSDRAVRVILSEATE